MASQDSRDGQQAIAQLTDLLETTWRIRLKENGRTFTGKFMMVDRQSNVILDETTEETTTGKRRNVGLVMVPGQSIESAQVDRDSLHM